MKAILLFVCLIFLCFSGIKAQQTVPASGGQATGGDGTVSYTVGQVAYGTMHSADGSVTEGVQQPWEISVVNGIDVAGIDLDISAFPNPTSNNLTLTVASGFRGLSYQLYDMQGKTLQNRVIGENNTSIDLTGYAPAIYFLRVRNETNEIKTFKIIKNE
ncbi:MAG: T9SS type A sorting domain-containing protein [Prolixibacteraceae bacterium]|nr:T9SS type A sorting domain-containing protein [Prolixibacteraceae bacterium]